MSNRAISWGSNEEIDAALRALENLTDTSLEPLFLVPDLLEKPSAWFGHVPFAHWLITAARPRVLVELGTHAGVSYSAMCSMVKRENLETKCFAVDTWKGDEHAGAYPEEIYQELAAFNDKHYRDFSTLIRALFDEALPQFEDGSIDILHIDGFHSYEAVSHDFHTWRPKLSDRAVVLFHDTNEFKKGFEVYRFWDEVSAQFPSFSFLHGHGLGVLAVGENAPAPIKALCSIQDESERTVVRQRFETLGVGLEHRARSLRAREVEANKKVASVNPIDTPLQQQLDHSQRSLLEAQNEARALKLNNIELTETRSRLTEENKRLEQQRKKSAEAAVQLAAEKEKLSNDLANVEQHRARCSELERTIKQLKMERAEILSSTSWLITTPIRDLSRLSPPVVKRLVKKAASLQHRALNKCKRSALTKRIRQSATAQVVLNRLRGGKDSTSLVFDTKRSTTWIKELSRHSSYKAVIKQQPLVSVILPTRNRLHTVPHAIASVLNQSYSNWELLIIDDGSTDGTTDFIRSNYKDARIKVLSTPGAGVCAARNCGMAAATGEFIAYLDSDNTWAPRYLELMLAELERSKADCGYAVLHCVNIKPAFYRQRPFDFETLKTRNFIDLNVFMHRKSVTDSVGRFDESLKRMVDWDLIMRCVKDRPVTFAYFVGAEYDSSDAADRITNSESLSYLDVVRNKHWIDWQGVQAACRERDANVVSIIICVYGQPELTDSCLTSLVTTEAGEPFEIILVDNGSDPSTRATLESWAAKNDRIRLITNPENFNFALGNNIGFAASKGSRVVFLNNDTQVTAEWLRALVRPLASAEIKATQPKLLFPDGSIQCVGLVFSDKSPLAYPIYVNHPGDFEPTQRPRNYSALTAACIAMRAEDFAHAGGFDPLYTNGQEDVDLCLRIGNGEPVFRYVADSVVFHHESKSAGRGKNIQRNRQVFFGRWNGRVTMTDQSYYTQDGVTASDYAPDNEAWATEGYAVWRPRSVEARLAARQSVSKSLQSKTIAIKIGCPRPEIKDHWGDYHFAVSLAGAFARRGIRTRIDFLKDWQQDKSTSTINLVLRGLSKFEPRKGSNNLMWMISHPDKVAPEELNGYDYVFVASSLWANHLTTLTSAPIEPLLQCTDIARFHPENFEASKITSNLFVANSRKVLRPIVRDALDQGLTLDIFGEMWEGLAPLEWVRASKIDNVDLPKYYASAKVVLNDHWESMRTLGFVSNRVFDVLACGAPLVTDRVAGFPPELADACHFFDENTPLQEAIAKATREPGTLNEQGHAVAELVRQKHSFDARAARIIEVVEGLL
jgi:glycosyltransferase involved in cell wall biosynthesis